MPRCNNDICVVITDHLCQVVNQDIYKPTSLPDHGDFKNSSPRNAVEHRVLVACINLFIRSPLLVSHYNRSIPFLGKPFSQRTIPQRIKIGPHDTDLLILQRANMIFDVFLRRAKKLPGNSGTPRIACREMLGKRPHYFRNDKSRKRCRGRLHTFINLLPNLVLGVRLFHNRSDFFKVVFRAGSLFQELHHIL